jgi:hypothetical protein
MNGGELDLGPIEKLLKEPFPGVRYFDVQNGVLVHDTIAALVAEVKRLRSFIQQTKSADDIIYAKYKQLMAALPECPEHGECVPFAIDWIRSKE